MNAFDALMYVFLFSVVSKMSHSELNFPCPVTLKQPWHYSDISAVLGVMMGTKLQSVARISVILSDLDNQGGDWAVITSGK